MQTVLAELLESREHDIDAVNELGIHGLKHAIQSKKPTTLWVGIEDKTHGSNGIMCRRLISSTLVSLPCGLTEHGAKDSVNGYREWHVWVMGQYINSKRHDLGQHLLDQLASERRFAPFWVFIETDFAKSLPRELLGEIIKFF